PFAQYSCLSYTSVRLHKVYSLFFRAHHKKSLNMDHKFADKFSCLFMSAALAITITACSTSSEDGWKKVNQQLLEKHKLKANVLSGLPSNNIKSNLEAGIIQPSQEIDSLELYPGVSAKLSWG